MLIESITPHSVRELMETPGPCLTLVFHGAPPAGLPSEALEAIKHLPVNGMAPRQIAVLHAPTRLIVTHVSDSVQPIQQTGERFNLRTVLAIAGSQRSFYILALSQKRSRLLACTQDHVEEVQWPEGTPASLSEEEQTRQPDHNLKSTASGGPSTGSMRGVMSGTNTDRDDKDEHLAHFFKALDRAVNTVLKDRREPLVVVAVEHELALYKRANTYPNMAQPGVHGAPDGLEGGEMHRRAVELLEARPQDAALGLLRDFDKKAGTGHASTHIHDIVAAACEGRISHLYFQNSARHPGTFDAVRQRVRHADSGTESESDLVETAAAETLRHGGEVRLVTGSAMPNGVPVCALFRYPATKIA